MSSAPQRFFVLFIFLTTLLLAGVPSSSDILHMQTFSLGVDEQFLLFSGIYYGVFLLLFFYALVIFAAERSRNHLFYLFFIVSFGFWELSSAQAVFRPDSDWIWLHASGVAIGLVMLFLILFSRTLLKIEVFAPKLDRVLLFLALAVSAFTFSALFLPVKMMAALLVVPALFLLATGIFSSLKAFSPARFYTAGMASFLAAAALLGMRSLQMNEKHLLVISAQHFFSALGLLFFAWALVDLVKINEGENVEKLNVLNRLLEEKMQKIRSQIRQNNHVLIEKSRLAAMGEKIEQIAHQWRQPLHALALINQNLYFKTQLDTVTKEDYEEVHDKMNEQLQYMSQTIDDFRNFSKSNKKKEVFVIEAVIKSAINLSEGSLENAKVKTELISQGEHRAFGMRHELMQVFMSLIKNAHDVIREKNIHAPWLKIVVTENENETQIRVEDNGGGIDSDVITRIFQPYFSTKHATGGSGIGLYMSKEIIEKSMLGRITVSNGEAGAIFSILLPKTTRKTAK